jgi:hypothetical protein
MPKRLSRGAHISHIVTSDSKIGVRRHITNASEIRRRRSFGALIGGDLLSWVAVPKTAAQKRVDSILKLIVELRDLNRAQGGAKERSFLWQGKIISAHSNFPKDGLLSDLVDQKPGVYDLWVELNRRFMRYRFTPFYWCELGDRPVIGWTSHQMGIKQKRVEKREDFSEEDAIICIVELAREGLFEDLRSCIQCGRWFFANFSHQKFDSNSCRQKHHRSDSEFKETRRIYMRNLRAQHKERWHPESATEAIKIASRKSSISPSARQQKKQTLFHKLVVTGGQK